MSSSEVPTRSRLIARSDLCSTPSHREVPLPSTMAAFIGRRAASTSRHASRGVNRWATCHKRPVTNSPASLSFVQLNNCDELKKDLNHTTLLSLTPPLLRNEGRQSRTLHTITSLNPQLPGCQTHHCEYRVPASHFTTDIRISSHR